MDKVQYLGYIVDVNGVHVDPTKIQVICYWPSPTTLTEIQIFLGLSNSYRRFVLGFSHIAWAINKITKGGGKEHFLWGLSQHKAFDDMKQHYFSAPVLSLSDLQHPFEIEKYIAEVYIDHLQIDEPQETKPQIVDHVHTHTLAHPRCTCRNPSET
jgi:hypothetical protein